VCDPNDVPASIGLNDLRIEQSRQWPPARLGLGPLGLAALGLEPVG
jgi:hypothetical protein